MAVFTIQSPDGRKIKVEADSQDLALQGAQEWAKANPLAPTKPTEDVQKDLSSGQSRFSQLPPADQDRVARAESGTVDNAVRGLARGVPFLGSWGDEINARLNAAAGGYLGGSQAPSYDQRVTDNLAYERAKDRTFDADHPAASMGLKVAGGVAGMAAAAPMAAGEGLLAAGGRTALGIGAKTLPGAIARGGAAGLLQGAAAGAGDADGGFVDRGVGAIQGGAIGLGLGMAIPAGFEYLRRAGSGVYNRIAGDSTPLSELSNGARRYVGEISTPDRLARVEQDLQRLGPNAMLADVSPEWQMVARGAAARPGSRDLVVDALTSRDAGKNVRLAEDLNQSLGPAPVPSQIESGLEASRGALGQDYGQVFSKAGPVDTQELAKGLDESAGVLRGDSRRAVERVRGWLDDPNAPKVAQTDPNAPKVPQLDTNASALFQVRQEIDGQLSKETNPKIIRELTDARRQVDGLLADSVPGLKAVDAQYQELARQSEGLQRGGQILDSGKTAIRPQELAQELQAGALPQGQLVGPSAVPLRMQQGVRAEIDRVAGTNANDPIALQRLVKGEGDWNRTKLGQVFGQDNADQALGAIDREVQFRNTTNRVTSGSDTGATAGFREFLDRAERPITGGGANADITAFGALAVAGKRLGGYLMGELGKARANRYATELARAAIATGVSRDEFVSALQDAGMKQQSISKALDYATRTGLVGAREAPGLLPKPQNGR